MTREELIADAHRHLEKGDGCSDACRTCAKARAVLALAQLAELEGGATPLTTDRMTVLTQRDVDRLIEIASEQRARAEAAEAALAPFAEWLKDGETPFERLVRERKDNDALLGLLAKEKTAVKELEAKAAALEAENARVREALRKHLDIDTAESYEEAYAALAPTPDDREDGQCSHQSCDCVLVPETIHDPQAIRAALEDTVEHLEREVERA